MLPSETLKTACYVVTRTASIAQIAKYGNYRCILSLFLYNNRDEVR
jgi:hypothetical protein